MDYATALDRMRAKARQFHWEPAFLKNGPPAPLASLNQTLHYDVIHCYEECRAHSTNPPSFDPLVAVAVYQYRDKYALPAAGVVSGYFQFATGCRDHWFRTGDSLSRDAAILLSRHGGYGTDQQDLAALTPTALSREVAFAIISQLDAEDCGAARRSRLDAYVQKALGHLDLWLVPTDKRPVCWVLQPYMAGFTMKALIAYWDRYRDATVPGIPAKIKATLDLLWVGSHAGFPFWRAIEGASPGTGAFGYQFPDSRTMDPKCGASAADVGGPWPLPSLNTFISPAYHWYYQFSGDETYRDRGDAAFIGAEICSLNDVMGSQKAWNESYYWCTASPRWRDLGTDPPPTADTLELTPPADPSVRANVPGPLWTVALGPGRVRVDKPVVVRVVVEPDGRALPATVRLTTDTPRLKVRVVAHAPGPHTVRLVPDSPLAVPEPIAFEAAPGPPLATGFRVTAPVGANAVGVPSPPFRIALDPPGSVPGPAHDATGGLVPLFLSTNWTGTCSPPAAWLTAERGEQELTFTPFAAGTKTLGVGDETGKFPSRFFAYTPGTVPPPTPVPVPATVPSLRVARGFLLFPPKELPVPLTARVRRRSDGQWLDPSTGQFSTTAPAPAPLIDLDPTYPGAALLPVSGSPDLGGVDVLLSDAAGKLVGQAAPDAKASKSVVVVLGGVVAAGAVAS